MSRKGNTPQRTVLPDPKHGSDTITRFINMVMQSGKKSVAEKIVYGAMDVIGEKNPNALELVEKALGNVSPSIYRETVIGENDHDQAGMRVDVNLTPQSQFFGRYSYSGGTNLNPVSIRGTDVPGFATSVLRRSRCRSWPWRSARLSCNPS